MNFELKFKSIGMRWFLNIFLIVAVAVLIFVIAFSAIYRSFYVERIHSLADEYSFEFSFLNECTTENFTDAAVMLSEDFPDKNRLEIQVFDETGRMIVSTTGFESDGNIPPDLKKALDEKTESATYQGENEGGEQILSSATLLYNTDGVYLGAYRWITSMRAVNVHITGVVVLLALLFCGILCIAQKHI